MAYLLFKDGSTKPIPAEKAEQIWLVLNNELLPSVEQAEFCSKVRKVYLNWRNESTPDSYLAWRRKLYASQMAEEQVRGIFPNAKMV